MCHTYKEKTMKKYIKDILEDSLQEEVDVSEEWNRLFLAINKREKKDDKPRVEYLYFKILTYVAASLIGFIISIPVMKNIGRLTRNAGTYQMITLKGEKSCLRLPDGSKVWANSCTTLEYDDRFGMDNRNIKLKGEAYFEVAKNKDVPFIVHTSDIQVRAVGTAFNVLAYPSDSQVLTTLYEGKVAVNSKNGGEEVILEENQVAEYNKNDNKVIKRDCNEGVDEGWRQGNLVFNMISLKEISNKLERKYDVFFLFENEKVKNMKFKGVFRETESIKDILDVIMLNTGVKCELDNDTIIVK